MEPWRTACHILMPDVDILRQQVLATTNLLGHVSLVAVSQILRTEALVCTSYLAGVQLARRGSGYGLS